MNHRWRGCAGCGNAVVERAFTLYIAVMTRWRPGKWLEANAPKLIAIAERKAATPGVAAALQRDFG